MRYREGRGEMRYKWYFTGHSQFSLFEGATIPMPTIDSFLYHTYQKDQCKRSEILPHFFNYITEPNPSKAPAEANISFSDSCLHHYAALILLTFLHTRKANMLKHQAGAPEKLLWGFQESRVSKYHGSTYWWIRSQTNTSWANDTHTKHISQVNRPLSLHADKLVWSVQARTPLR